MAETALKRSNREAEETRNGRYLHQDRLEAEVEGAAEAGAEVAGVDDRLSAAWLTLNFFTLSGI